MVVASLQRVDATPKSKAVAGAGQCAAAVPTVSDAVRSPGRVSRKKVEQEESDPGSRPVLRRQSLRIQTKQKQKEQLAQRKKELAVERRAELLDVEQNGRAKKRVKVRKRVASETVENGKMAAPKEELKGVAASLGEEKSNASDEKSDYVKVKETLCELLLSGRTKDENGASADGADRLNAAEKSHHAKVKETLRLFNKHYLHFVEEEEKRCRKEAAEGKRTVKISKKFKFMQKGNAFEEDKKQLAKRPDLKAITKMRETKTILNPKRRVGDIPGIKVGHQFYSRAEMVVVGFHNHWLNGIDYMGCAYQADYPKYSFPLAVGIVLSGMYEDDLDNADEIVYTGQGGQNLIGDKRQIQDQKLERGNLALKNCTVHGVPVRVVRGHECVNSYTGRIYTYDGLYKVVKYWADKGISGFTVYKYRLKRVLGQPMLTTNQVQFAYGRVPASVSDLRGLVCDDITGGQEKYAIPASNLVDDPPVPPSGYKYVSFIQVSNNVTLPKAAAGCSCKGTCIDPKTCACARLNGSNFPYVQRDGGR
ncbi:hypothetical protein SAY86_003659 [Trapa natans]|uniref:YDG domain-containing protein n=1 Tax=Trapa natans TaxID=22666 RepID=A0AAN7MSK0_TRANT|nr:hypothetical protein SAY86_003659 [Trapa natans]